MWLRSCDAVAVLWAGSCSSDSNPSLVISICHGCGPKKTGKKKKERLGYRHIQKRTVGKHREKVALYKPRRKVSEETSPTGTLIFNF